MSEATFQAPTGPTQGLQGYALDRGPKNLYPATMAGLLTRIRTIAARRKAKRGALQKGTIMPPFETALTGYVDTLRTSVTSITAQAAPDQRDRLIEQSLGEFADALRKSYGEAEELAKAEGLGGRHEEDPLLKGLGCVGRIAQLVQTLSEQTKNIIEGRSLYAYAGANDKDAPKPDDPASEEVAQYLNGMLRLGEMALRTAVNEHVEPADDDEAPEGMRLVLVPNAEDPGDERLAVVVKTTLPEDLAKFATDPGMMDEAMIEFAAILMANSGVDAGSLEKFLGGGGLAKAFGEEDQEEGAEPEGEEGNEAGMEQDDDPLDAIGRLGAAIVIQVGALQDMLSGGAGDAEGAQPAGPARRPQPPQGEAGAGEDEAGGGDEASGEGEGEGEGEEDPEKKKAEMGKAAQVTELTKLLRELTPSLAKISGVELPKLPGDGAGGDAMEKFLQAAAPALQKLAAMPQAPKGAVVAVAKEQDGAGGELNKASGLTEQERIDELAKRDPEAALMASIRRQHRLGVQATPV